MKAFITFAFALFIYLIPSDICAGPEGYEYLPGDTNMGAGLWPPSVLGGDVTYLVNYFRGFSEPCMLDGFFASADVNGDCNVIGSDVTYLVSYIRGFNLINYCPDWDTPWPHSDLLPPVAPVGWPNCEY